MSPTESVQSGMDCLEGARRGIAWLLSQQRPDGGWTALDKPPVDAFYKAAAAFSLMGENVAAERSLDYVKKNLLDPDGDFLPRGDAWFIDVHYQYANGWLVLGAQRAGRYDVSGPAIRFLLTQQDPATGGFYGQKSVNGQKRRIDTMSSGIAGVACIATGQIAAACRLADFFEKLIELQPDPSKFYITLDADGRLGTDFPADESWRVIDTKKPDQVWYAVGLPFVFALLLHEATGEPRYAKLWKWFFDFQTRCVNPWDGSSSGKAAWGSSILYHLTGEKRYLGIAVHVLRKILSCQTPEGWFAWGGPAAYGGAGVGAKQFNEGDFDITAEYVVWLALIGSNLLAR